MNPDPAVSIITPAFNAERTLAETIDSCLAQTWADFELVIVDDGSRDGTFEVATAYARRDGRIRVVQQQNGGISAARNRAMAEARGRRFALLDSDDLWMPEYLATQLRLLDDRRAGVVTANAINLGGRHDGATLWPTDRAPQEISLLDLIERENSVCIMAVFDRAVYDAIGGFDPQLRSNEDYDYWIRAVRSGFRVVANFQPLGYYRRRADSVSGNERRMLRGITVVLESVGRTLPPGSPERAAAERQVARFNRELLLAEARDAIARGEERLGIAYMEQIPRRERSLALSALVGIGRFWPQALRYALMVRGRSRFARKPPARVPPSAECGA